MRVGAAQVGPDQHLGPFVGVLGREASGDEDRGGEGMEIGGGYAEGILAHFSLSPATDLYQSRICTPFQCSTPSNRFT